MTKWSTVIYCILFASTVYAQEKNTNSLPATECAFAKYASTHNVKQAFLTFLDSNGVVFNKGTARNGLAVWRRQPDNNFRLVWHPVYYVVSADGSLGFTTGPYEAGSGATAGFGNFTSIWRRDANNEWKLLADLGTSYASSLYDTLSPTTFSDLTPAVVTDTSAMQIEQQFISAFEQQGVAVYKTVIINGSWLNTDKQHPAQIRKEINRQLAALDTAIKFTPVAGAMAKSRDLAYVYGTVMYKQGKENYLRVWVHTHDGWKVLCQVIKIVD